MAKVTLWSGVQVDMQSAIGAALVVSAVTKANPGVATSTAHGLANGDYVVLQEVQGMTQINNRLFRVAGVTTNTFNLDGEDTTLFDTYISGNAYKVTFGTSFSTLLDINVSGGEYSPIDTTTIHDRQATSIPGIPSALELTSNSFWDVSDVGLVAAKKASDLKALRAFKLTFQNGQKFLVNGYIGASLSPTGSAQDKVTTSIKISANGPSTVYAS